MEEVLCASLLSQCTIMLMVSIFLYLLLRSYVTILSPCSGSAEYDYFNISPKSFSHSHTHFHRLSHSQTHPRTHMNTVFPFLHKHTLLTIFQSMKSGTYPCYSPLAEISKIVCCIVCVGSHDNMSTVPSRPSQPVRVLCVIYIITLISRERICC